MTTDHATMLARLQRDPHTWTMTQALIRAGHLDDAVHARAISLGYAPPITDPELDRMSKDMNARDYMEQSG